ncbi:MAG: hypothetical protein FIA92_17550 [Chloroflexi bacterium]|nr:hypothetical protein [Chloroflexota bacterium]
MSSPPPAAVVPGAADDLRLAQLHLRLGQLTLARAELEDLASRELLDVEGQAALAEARWRTDSAEAAAAAAQAHLAGGGSDPIAICIAVEAATAEGRPQEARDLIGRLGVLDPMQVDALFAGMPQRAAWPLADTGEARPMSAIPGPRAVLEAAGTPGSTGFAGAATPGPPGAARGSSAAAAGRVELERRARAVSDPAAELRRAREELASRPDRAVVRLALVLRLDPALAPAVLDAVALRREPAAALVRGDAQRLLGRHLEAEAAFDAAAESLEAS